MGEILKNVFTMHTKKNLIMPMLHGDNQYNPKYIKNMLELLIKNNDIATVLGSRMYNKSNALKGNMPIYKFIGNIFLTKLFNLFYKN